MTGLTRELAGCNTVEAQIRGIGTHLWHKSCEQRKLRCLEATDHDWPRDTAIIINLVLESLVLYMFLIIRSVFAVIFHHCRILSTSINLSTDYQRSNTYSQQTCGYYIAIGYYPMDKIHYSIYSEQSECTHSYSCNHTTSTSTSTLFIHFQFTITRQLPPAYRRA